MRGLFFGCSSLKYLPDISRWNISNTINIEYLFHDCSSLEFLPDLSKWKIKKVKKLNNIFFSCSSLNSLPDISKWDTSNINSMKGLFFGCSSLKYLPDISKWNIQNVTDISGMFGGCSSLKNLPDISNWRTDNIKNMSFLFCGKSKLLTYLYDKKNFGFLNDSSLQFKKDNPGLIENINIFLSPLAQQGIDIDLLMKNKDLYNESFVSKVNSFIHDGSSSLLSLPDISKWNTNNVIINVFISFFFKITP